jgi:hypothetical protein
MGHIPIHLQRRFEQRWVARFAASVAALAPKSRNQSTAASKSKSKIRRVKSAYSGGQGR